jgi:hypothetical protein
VACLKHAKAGHSVCDQNAVKQHVKARLDGIQARWTGIGPHAFLMRRGEGFGYRTTHFGIHNATVRLDGSVAPACRIRQVDRVSNTLRWREQSEHWAIVQVQTSADRPAPNKSRLLLCFVLDLQCEARLCGGAWDR